MTIHLWKLVRLEERRKIGLQSEYKRIECEQKFNAKILAASEKYMKRVVFLYKYKSGCRWTTGAQARSIFHSLSSDTKKLEAVKDQILMRTLGCGWKHLYPQWQVDNRKRTADELLEHLITVVMEYENSAKAIVLPSVSVKLVSRQKGLTQMGTVTADVKELKSRRKEKRKKIRAQVKTDLNVNEDKWKSKCQPYQAPKRDKIWSIKD